VADLATAADLSLVELNPVFARPDGVTVVDAVIRRGDPGAGGPGARRLPGAGILSAWPTVT
jgi:hypothetical protein